MKLGTRFKSQGLEWCVVGILKEKTCDTAFKCKHREGLHSLKVTHETYYLCTHEGTHIKFSDKDIEGVEVLSVPREYDRWE